MKVPIVILILVFTSLANAQPPRVWASQFSVITSVISIDVDNKGAVYMFGSFGGTVDFDPSAGVSAITATSNSDLYLLKTDRDGNFEWVRQFSPGVGNSMLSGTALKCDGDSSCYISGQFHGQVDFDPSAQTKTLSAPPGGGHSFLIRLDNAGQLQWAKKFEGTTLIQKITMGEAGNLYMTGKFFQSVDFDPDTVSTSTVSTNFNATNAFLLKLSYNGKFRWVKSLVSQYDGEGLGVIYDTLSKQCCFVGSAEPSTDLDPGPGQNITQTRCGFICVVDTLGNTLHSKSINGTCMLTSVAANSGWVLSGWFSGTADVDPGVGVQNIVAIQNSNDAFIAKLSSTLSLLWVKEIDGGTNTNITGGDLMLDKNFNIYYFTRFIGSIDVDPSSVVLPVTSVPTAPPAIPYDYLVASFNSTGNLLWHHSMGPCWTRQSPGFATANGDIYLSCVFTGTIDVDPTTAGYIFTSTPYRSAFLERLSDCLGKEPQVSIIGFPATTVCPGTQVTLSSSGADSYKWFHGPTANVVSVNPNSTMYYKVMGTDTAGCSSVTGYSVVTGICNQLKENSLSANTIYPNPSTNVINVQTKAGDRIFIYDQSGKLVQTPVTAKSVNTSIDLSELKPGVYSVTVRSTTRSDTLRVILQP